MSQKKNPLNFAEKKKIEKNFMGFPVVFIRNESGGFGVFLYKYIYQNYNRIL